MAIYTGYQYRVNVQWYKVVEVAMYCTYSGKKKYVNPLELSGFLLKLVIKFDLIFIPATTVDKHSMLKLITHKLLYFSCLY
jgi:hypothetical protein